jgi:hypothetical protein
MIGNIFKQSLQSVSNHRSSYYITKMEVNYNSRQNVHKLYVSHNSGYITLSQFLRLGNLAYFYDNISFFRNRKSWKRSGLDLIKVPTYPISFSFSNAISNEAVIMTHYLILFQRKIRELIRKRKYREIFLLQGSLFRNNIDLPRDIVRTIYTYL